MFDFTPTDLRRNQTVSERILWNYLKARQMLGLKFRRQHAIGPFIADFVCVTKKIIVEVDGPIHDQRRDYDQKRDEWFRSRGFTVFRIQNQELEKNLIETLTKLRFSLRRFAGY